MIDVLSVMDTDARAIALVADGCVGLRKKQWEHHLTVHDDAKTAVADVINGLCVAVKALEQSDPDNLFLPNMRTALANAGVSE